VIRQAVFSPRVGFWAARLLKAAELRVLHDQVLYKPPSTRDGAVVSAGNIGWHQDAPHFDVFDTTTFITAWIALQDCSLDNGTIQFIAGSHRWGYCRDANTFREKDLDDLQKRFADGERPWRPVAAIMRPGQVSVHSGLIFHGSGPNRSDRPRMSIAVNLMPGDTRYNKYGRYHFLGSLMGPLVRHGDHCGDPLFPRIWPPNHAMTAGARDLDGAAR
jgi:ectoine hydroxylase-related dioxygenase (phytanoyl-CoA dioxygenase family)